MSTKLGYGILSRGGSTVLEQIDSQRESDDLWLIRRLPSGIRESIWAQWTKGRSVRVIARALSTVQFPVYESEVEASIRVRSREDRDRAVATDRIMRGRAMGAVA